MDTDGDPCQNKFRVAFWPVVLCALSSFLFSCKSETKWLDVDPAFSKYIEAYTSGTISKTSSVRIQLAESSTTTHATGDIAGEELFKFSPSVKGKTTWVDARTIEFKPEENLKSDQLYEVTFRLSKVTTVPDKYKELRFNVQTVKPSFKLTDYGLRSNNKTTMSFSGELETADIETSAQVEKLLQASQDKRNLKISWQHNDAAKTHDFVVEGLSRGAAGSQLLLTWNGKSIDSDNKGEKQVAIPAAGDFKVLNVIAMNDNEQYASVQFSDPIAIGQDLTGLITVAEHADPTYTINGSEVKLFLNDKVDGNYTININTGIKNSWNDVLSKEFVANIFFENKMPSISIHGHGNILPNTGKLVLPFEAINLNAVDISIIRIYENSIPQFLQNNNIDGGEDLRRVGRPIVQKTLRLDDDKTVDLHKRQRFSLDIDKYLKTEPGAIYRVTIGFRPTYSLYSCQPLDDSEGSSEEGEGDGDYGYYRTASREGVDDDSEFWSSYDDYYTYGYNWDQKDNPCSKSYYNKERWATRNIIASNIGLTVKRANNNSMMVAVTNLLTTEPMDDVELLLLDYQHQVIHKTESDNDGFAMFDIKRKPYLLVAKLGKERGYLKIDDGSALPISRFDVAGEEIKNGIKGFVFGERGVWRPGDSIYLNCILEDKEGKLPADHPVELSLFTPQGQLYKRMVQNEGMNGYYVFRTSTDQSSPTGNWIAKVKAGGAVFEKRIKVETVMPNRLKIDVDFGKDPVLGVGSTNTGTLMAKWLFGATAKNLKAKIDASLYKVKTTFKKFDQFSFDNPVSNYSTQTKVIFDGPLDAEGKGTINPDFQLNENAPGMLNANLLVKVFEPGGSFSVDNLSIPYSPYDSYAGLKVPEGDKTWGFLLTGKVHTAQIVNVDSKGNLLTGSHDLEVEFYRIQWRWWWDNSEDDLSNFTQDKYNKLLKKDTLHTTNGTAKWNFKIPSGDWGRFLILVKDKASGHTTGQIVYMDDPGWQSRSNSDDPSSASMLTFSPDKSKYNVGDEVSLTIPGSKGGRGLVSIESGSRIIRSFWIKTTEGQNVVKFKAEKEMAPNVYVSVSLIQPHQQTVNDLPIRMYGVQPIFVEDKNTTLQPVVSMAASIRPEQQTSLTVSESAGKEMTYSVALVDEGLLDLTRFKTPDPHAAFFAREAIGVKSWDVFDYVIGAWGGGLDRILTIGGDAEAGPAKQKQANRFKPVVKFMGPFHLPKGDKQTHNFTLPNYIGSVRVMVVAAQNGSYGKAEKAVAVKKPLMMLATMPRVLGPGETIKLPVTIFATENNIRSVNVSLQSNAFLETSGPSSQTISFTQPGEQMVYFDVAVKPNTGIGKVKLLASSGNEKAVYEVELDVRNPNPAVTSVTEKVLTSGLQWSVPVSPIGTINGSNSMLELSSVPPMNLAKRLDYLIRYPHGCIEQVTSSVFPQLVLNQLIDLDATRKAMIDKNVRAGISRLQSFQNHDGGFSYWPNGGESDDWGTNYAGHFLLEAQAHGYSTAETLLGQWKSFEISKANAWVVSSSNFYGADLTQAYRLFLLAMAKSPQLGAMNRLREFRYISPEAKWRLAAAYKLVGQNNVALQLISGLPVNFNQRDYPGFTYGSDVRDEAMVLETLTLLGKRQEAFNLLTSLAADMSKDSWYSTQTTAYTLIAISKYCGTNASGSKIVVNGSVNGSSFSFNTAAYVTQKQIDLSKGVANLVVKNTAGNTLFARIITTGQPLAGQELKVNNNPNTLGLTVSYLNQEGKPMDISKLSQGSDFIAKVVIKNPGMRGYYSQMALTQIFPSGWEILNTRMQDGEGQFNSSPSDYQDVRDDRVYTYFNLRENETLTYYFQLNAAYLGRYFLPGTFCEAMYDNNISAGVNGKWVEVIN